MFLKIVLLLGLLAEITGTPIKSPSFTEKGYLISEELIKEKGKIKPFKNESQIIGPAITIVYRYRIKSEAQLAFENQIGNSTNFLKIVPNDTNDVDYEFIPVPMPVISESTMEELKVERLSDEVYYIYGVEHKLESKVDKYLRSKGFPPKVSAALYIHIRGFGFISADELSLIRSPRK